MQKKRLPAEDKVESWLLFLSSIPLLHTAYHIARSFKQTVGAGIVSVVLPIPYCVEVNYWQGMRKLHSQK